METFKALSFWLVMAIYPNIYEEVIELFEIHIYNGKTSDLSRCIYIHKSGKLHARRKPLILKHICTYEY